MIELIALPVVMTILFVVNKLMKILSQGELFFLVLFAVTFASWGSDPGPMFSADFLFRYAIILVDVIGGIMIGLALVMKK